MEEQGQEEKCSRVREQPGLEARRRKPEASRTVTHRGWTLPFSADFISPQGAAFHNQGPPAG